MKSTIDTDARVRARKGKAGGKVDAGVVGSVALVVGMAVFIVGALVYNLDFLHFGRNSAISERSALSAGDAQVAADHMSDAVRAAEVIDPDLVLWRQQGVFLAALASRSSDPALVAYAEEAGDIDRRALEAGDTETMLPGYALDDVADADFDRVYLDAWIDHVEQTPPSAPEYATTTQLAERDRLVLWRQTLGSEP